VDHSRTIIFGCPVMVLKNGTRPALDNHSRHGRFAGYNGTMKKIIYFPKGKTKPLENSHVQFHELFSSYKTEPPIVQELRRAMGRETMLDSNTRRDTGISDNFYIISENEQFAKIRCISVTPSGTRPLGIILETDLQTKRGYIFDVLPKSLMSSTKNWRTELIGSFITRVDDELVFTKQEITGCHYNCTIFRYRVPDNCLDGYSQYFNCKEGTKSNSSNSAKSAAVYRFKST